MILGQLEPWIDQINGIGVSVFPRRRADSYMPAFLVGKGMAASLSYVLRVPVFEFSHQENHALAAIQNMPEIWGTPFYMMHLSGGTQDVLSVEWEKDIMQIVDLIHSADITAGQFIDRVGVSLGMPFPAGPSMERLAMKHQQLYKVPVANVKNGFSLPARKRRYSVIYKLSVIHQKILLMAFFPLLASHYIKSWTHIMAL